MERIKGTKYSVTKDGKVFSHYTNKFMKQSIGTSGYYRLVLRVNGKPINKSVHRLVAIAFLGLFNGMQVNHKNGDKLDNRVSNLEWVTHSENAFHAHKKGLINKVQRKLKPAQVRAIRKSNRTLSKEADKYGVSIETISRVKRGKIYKEIV